MDTPAAKMNADLSTLVKALGEDILGQARQFQLNKILSESKVTLKKTGNAKKDKAAAEAAEAAAAASSPKEEKISAEYFQFWQQLCQFADKYVPFTDILKKPVTWIRSEAVTVTITNLLPTGGPLNADQIASLNGFLDAKIIANNNIDVLLETSKPFALVKRLEVVKSEEEGEEGTQWYKYSITSTTILKRVTILNSYLARDLVSCRHICGIAILWLL